MRKLFNKKGFTLAELLIVVAIIAILTAIAIPVFTAQLNKAKYATDEANARSIYAEMTSDYLANGGEQSITVDPASVTQGSGAQTVEVKDSSGNVMNSYSFTGIVGIQFTLGDDDSNPSVHIDSYGSYEEVNWPASGS
jgi:type IV pilus assembly protein PilA